MIHYSRVIQGLMLYIENEIAAKLAGSWKAWVVRGMAGMASMKAEPLFRTIAANPIVSALGIVEGENVNVDMLIAELRKQAQTSTATIDIPGIGPYTVGVADVDALNRYIRG